MRDNGRRAWSATYPQHVRDRDVELDRVEEIVEEHAERLEKSVQCVAFVDRLDRTGPGVRVVLRVFFPRHVDEDVADRVVSWVDVEIIEAIYEAANGGDGA